MRRNRIRWKTSTAVLILLDVLILTFALAPIGIVILSSVTPTRSVEFPPPGLSTRWYQKLVTMLANDPQYKQGLSSSFVVSLSLALFASAVAVGVGILSAYAFVRYQFVGRTLLEQLSTLPLTCPLVVSSIALLTLFSQGHLFSTFERLVIGHVLVTIPYTFRNCVAVLHGVDPALEDASMTLGASRSRTFSSIVLPLIKPGIIAGAIFAFITSFDMFTVSFFLYSGDMKPYPMWLFEYLSFYMDPAIAALSAFIIVIDIAAIVALDKILGIQKLTVA